MYEAKLSDSMETAARECPPSPLGVIEESGSGMNMPFIERERRERPSGSESTALETV
jgi:hypothetical protein